MVDKMSVKLSYKEMAIFKYLLYPVFVNSFLDCVQEDIQSWSFSIPRQASFMIAVSLYE